MLSRFQSEEKTDERPSRNYENISTTAAGKQSESVCGEHPCGGGLQTRPATSPVQF